MKDLVHIKGILGSMATAGINMISGMFGWNKPKIPRPTDNRVIIVYVVGGITGSEIRDIKKILSSQNMLKGHTVFVGSNCICQADDVLSVVLPADD